MCRDPYAPTSTSVASTSRSTQANETERPPAPQPQSSTNTGAIAGGIVAGVVALVAVIGCFVLWKRGKHGKDNGTSAPASVPGGGPSQAHAYSLGAVPPTPGTANPFLTPMSQHPNSGASYFGGPSNGASSASQYTGLPEPQHGDGVASSTGMSVVQVPQQHTEYPHSLRMSVTPMGEVDHGLGSQSPVLMPPSGQNTIYEDSNAPHTSRPWSDNDAANVNPSGLTSPGPSNVYNYASPAQVP
ncbi:hypothetical protein BN14_03813 [Rhizoctonia solani AG-1 IB]|uniref:Uncharacterized protein n=2 Tax=Rhizoctonia solani TaxID=456999 RepID=A0A8H3AQ71_9AGAM|nr:unnamed protein product [Rhizoctonia solani]CCO29792.1 hypothetical protein BN14_03813 [Rhizoctonia solani AG-1 IB]